MLQVEYEGPAGENNLTIVHAPHLILTHNTTHVLSNVRNQDFDDCKLSSMNYSVHVIHLKSSHQSLTLRNNVFSLKTIYRKDAE